MNPKFILGALALSGFLLLAIYIQRSSPLAADIVNAPAPDRRPSSLGETSRHSHQATHASAAQTQALSGALGRAVKNTLSKNPSVLLSSKEIEELERIFAAHYIAFANQRNQLITGEAFGGDTYEIHIPSCPEIGEKALASFLSDIKASNIASRDQLLPVAKRLFEGQTEQAGRNSVTYSIQFKEDSDYIVKFSRDVSIVDPVTRQVTGTGLTYGELDLRDADPALVAAIQKTNNRR